MAKEATKPLKITAHLSDGRLNSADGVVMLDGILYHAWFLKHAPHVLDGNGKTSFNGYFGLPLRQTDYGYMCSRAVYTEIAKEVDVINKRQDFFRADLTNYLDANRGMISSRIGEYRNYRIPSVIRVVKDGLLTFWAVGHKEEVADLLSRITATGKKNAIGYGIIDDWTVEETDEDYSLIHPKYGLMRPVPVEEAPENNCPAMMYATKPPYWKQSNARLCAVPIWT